MIGNNKAVCHVRLFCPERNKVRKTGTTFLFLASTQRMLIDIVTVSPEDCTITQTTKWHTHSE